MLWQYLARRVLIAIPVILGVTLLTFVLMHSTGGDYVPGVNYDNPHLSADTVRAVRHEYGLDLPWYQQYLLWLWNVLHFDFGRSMIDGSHVSDHILQRLPNTLELTISAIVIGILLSIPLGVAGALRRGSKLDGLFTTLSVAGFAIPEFWLGLLAILFFAVIPAQRMGAPLLPSSGAYDPLSTGFDPIDRLTHLILPAAVLGFGYVAIWSRFTRSSMLEVLSQDYVRTARAKGMSTRRVNYLHALRNAIIPLVTLVGLELPGLVSGGAVVEIVFGWPGIGRFAYERALSYDYTMVMGLTTFAALLVILGNLMADVLYAVLDPRIRYR